MNAVMRTKRCRRSAGSALVVVGLLVLTACTSGSPAAIDTVTSNVTRPNSSVGSTPPVGSTPAGGSTRASSAAGSSASASSSSSSAARTSSSASGSAAPAPYGPGGQVVKTEPDGFQITKLKAGKAAPQFIVFSFDGVGWDLKWQYWFGIAQKVRLHFTGFLSGIYMLSTATRDKYTGPGHAAGKSSIPFGQPADIPVEIGNLNKALATGDEIGTHFNGHFCDDNPPGGTQWNTDDWNNELDQFFALVKNVDVNNGINNKLNLPAGEIKGERTPCLTGDKADLYPALEAHGMDYDSTFTRPGLSWPTKSTDGKIWEMGMSEFPIAGSGHVNITMDYNYYAQQEPATVDGGPVPSVAKSAADSAQVLATYKNMLNGAMTDGVHEPLILGNHFNDWNNNAYSDAIGNFAMDECGKSNIYCVPFRDLVDWMNAQDPAVVAALQNHKSNLGGCPYTAFPHCDGKTND